MENRKFTEQEGIDVINNMIQATKFKMSKGFGNYYLVMGYGTLVISFLVYITLKLSDNNYWFHLLWALIAIPIFIVYFNSVKSAKKVRSYIDSAIFATWTMVSAALLIAIISIWSYTSVASLQVMLALCVILTSLGGMINGLILKDKWIQILPIISISIGFGMLSDIINGDISGELYFDLGASFIFSMIIPGHILNARVRKMVKQGNM